MKHVAIKAKATTVSTGPAANPPSATRNALDTMSCFAMEDKINRVIRKVCVKVT